MAEEEKGKGEKKKHHFFGRKDKESKKEHHISGPQEGVAVVDRPPGVLGEGMESKHYITVPASYSGKNTVLKPSIALSTRKLPTIQVGTYAELREYDFKPPVPPTPSQKPVPHGQL